MKGLKLPVTERLETRKNLIDQFTSVVIGLSMIVVRRDCGGVSHILNNSIIHVKNGRSNTVHRQKVYKTLMYCTQW